MNAEHWEKVKDLLDRVLKIEPTRRTAFLEKAGINGEILSEVESLLDFEAQSRDFMSLDLGEFSKDFVSDEAADVSFVGQKVGIYEITGELGFGGMGAVYLAERTDGKFKQKVAVKMLKREFNVGKIRKNFRREKEILSKLNHPNVSRLLDAGTTDDGVPYLVMEYIEGVPIDEFCKRKNLSLIQRLKLFNKICDAVSFAHRNLVIHRDLKPSNILLTEKGEPKLLDFGISKLLDAEENTLVTTFGAMTPEYASPEQIRGETVSTASDIYSLGVILYKILTDSLPFQLKGKTGGNLLKIITEDEPTLPSKSEPPAAAGGAGVGKHSFKSKQNPSTTAGGSAKSNPLVNAGGSDLSKLKGDLDNIILKAISKESEQRYKTVEQFSADIWRHLDGLPVLARPATFSYRTSKFFRRNKIQVIAVVIVLLSLITGIAVAFWQAREARGQARLAVESQRKAEGETEKANTERERSEKISRFMFKVIGYGNPAWYAEGSRFNGEAKILDAIEDLSDKIDVEFANEPDVAAELHHKFGEVFLWVEKKVSGEKSENFRQKQIFHFLRALELRRQFYGERHELVAKDLFYSYTYIGKTDGERAKILMEAIQMMRETNPYNLNLPYMFENYTAKLMFPQYESLHEPYRNAVIPPTDENNYQIAERYLRESLPVFRLHYKEDNSTIYAAECKLAYALALQDKWTDFNEHFGLCKLGKEKYEGKSKSLKMFYEMVEKVLLEKNKLNQGS